MMRTSLAATAPPPLILQQQQQQQQQQYPLPPHHHPSSFSVLAPSRTVVTSFTPKCQSFEQGDWVVALTARSKQQSTSDSGSIACALSNGEVQVYDPQRLHRLVTYTEEQQHETPSASPCITDLKYTSSSPSSNNGSSSDSLCCLWVTSANGSVRLYDIRQPSCAGQALLPRAAGSRGVASSLSSCSPPPAWTVALGCNGTLAAVASKRKIHFLDVRMITSSSPSATSLSSPSPWLGCYKDAHTDHVTCLRFLHNNSNGSDAQQCTTLLSGGEDGLVCVFDTTRSNEAEALQQVWNVGSSVRKLGTAFDNDNGNNSINTPHLQQGVTTTRSTSVWCLTGSETVQLWNPASNTVHSFGDDLRQQLSSRINIYNDSDGNSANNNATINLEYLVDAHWDASSRELLLAAGNADGDAALFRFSSSFSQQHQRQECCYDNNYDWEPCHVLRGGHRGVVRAVCHFSQSILLTAGEDARLCEWNKWGPQAHSATSSSISSRPHPHHVHHQTVSSYSSSVTAAGAGGGPVRRQRSRPTSGPY